ncbi:MAG: hypothetical protein JO102_05660 [Elusimicrobia bacterium]|nr:hypothetical protein [Elusimicrobiota bacterium]
MRPLKASLFFIYCLAALAAVGTAVSHLWQTAAAVRLERARLTPAAPAPDNNA